LQIKLEQKLLKQTLQRNSAEKLTGPTNIIIFPLN